MEWIHVLVMILGNAAWILPMFFWNRAESRSDIRHMDNKLDSMRNLIDAVQQEMKDFHGRLEKQDAEFKCFMKQEEEKRTRLILERK